MTFENPVVNGDVLVRNAIKTPGYVAGSAGWTINNDGSAEFNNVTVRGTVAVGPASGAQVIVQSLNGAGVVTLRSGGATVTPVNGELRAQENSIGPGIPPNQLQVSLSSPSDDGGVQPATLYLRKVVGGARTAEIFADTTAIDGAATVAGALGVTGLVTATAGIASAGAIDGTRSVASATVVSAQRTGDTASRWVVKADGTMVWGSGAGAADATIVRSGVNEFVMSNIKSFDALGTGVESWHGFSFSAGWANGVNVPGQYRLVASPARSLQLVGELNCSAATRTDGTVIAGLGGSAFWPAHTVTFSVAANPLPAGSMSPLLQLSSGGQLKCWGLTGLTTTIYFSAIVPLDA